jgi:hypothetical protein
LLQDGVVIAQRPRQRDADDADVAGRAEVEVHAGGRRVQQAVGGGVVADVPAELPHRIGEPGERRPAVQGSDREQAQHAERGAADDGRTDHVEGAEHADGDGRSDGGYQIELT